MDNCLENSAELMEFFTEHEAEVRKRYDSLVKCERSKDIIRMKGCAYCAARDYIFENGMTATDCQLNRMAEVLVYKVDAEHEEVI